MSGRKRRDLRRNVDERGESASERPWAAMAGFACDGWPLATTIGVICSRLGIHTVSIMLKMDNGAVGRCTDGRSLSVPMGQVRIMPSYLDSACGLKAPRISSKSTKCCEHADVKRRYLTEGQGFEYLRSVARDV